MNEKEKGMELEQAANHLIDICTKNREGINRRVPDRDALEEVKRMFTSVQKGASDKRPLLKWSSGDVSEIRAVAVKGIMDDEVKPDNIELRVIGSVMKQGDIKRMRDLEKANLDREGSGFTEEQARDLVWLRVEAHKTFFEIFRKAKEIDMDRGRDEQVLRGVVLEEYQIPANHGERSEGLK